MKTLILFLSLLLFSLNSLKGQAPDRLNRETGVYNFTQSKEAEKYYTEGYEATKAGNPEKAIKAYLKAIEIDSNFIEAYDNLAVQYRRTGELEKAEFYYKASIRKFPKGEMAYQNIAVVYEKMMAYEKALFYYEKLSKLSPKNPEGFYGACRIAVVLKKLDKAIIYGKKAIKNYKKRNDKWVMDAYFMTGVAYIAKGDLKNGKKYVDLAMKNGLPLSEQQLSKLGL